MITCEHGGHRVPPKYRSLFRRADTILKSHRGWDPGSLKLAQCFAAALSAPLFTATTTRLLVELNRSLGHPQLFSEFTKNIDERIKAELLQKYWHPYRHAVEAAIIRQINSAGQVVHISVHSFTPVLHGHVRRTDVGLLYDPGRPRERRFCRRWQQNLCAAAPGLTVHRNAPYRGIADGFVTALRRRFSGRQYVGVELEVNQRFLQASPPQRSLLKNNLISCLRDTFQELEDK